MLWHDLHVLTSQIVDAAWQSLWVNGQEGVSLCIGTSSIRFAGATRCITRLLLAAQRFYSLHWCVVMQSEHSSSSSQLGQGAVVCSQSSHGQHLHFQRHWCLPLRTLPSVKQPGHMGIAPHAVHPRSTLGNAVPVDCVPRHD